MRSKISLTKELRIAIALFEIPVSGCTCFSTAPTRHVSISQHQQPWSMQPAHTLIDIRAVSLLARLAPLLLLPISRRSGSLTLARRLLSSLRAFCLGRYFPCGGGRRFRGGGGRLVEIGGQNLVFVSDLIRS